MSTRQTIKSIIEREWDQFQHTNNEGGRASCQGNRPMFEVMRASQFAAWPQELLTSYLADLREADAGGRNLVTEKYARMMASTAPEIYALDLYERFVRECERRQENLTEQIIANTVRLGGYTNLDEAEAAQRRA